MFDKFFVSMFHKFFVNMFIKSYLILETCLQILFDMCFGLILNGEFAETEFKYDKVNNDWNLKIMKIDNILRTTFNLLSAIDEYRKIMSLIYEQKQN